VGQDTFKGKKKKGVGRTKITSMKKKKPKLSVEKRGRGSKTSLVLLGRRGAIKGGCGSGKIWLKRPEAAAFFHRKT